MAPAPRVFIDTNTLISGICFQGPPRQLILAAVEGRVTLMLAEYVLRETEAVIQKKMRDRQPDFTELQRILPFETVPLPSPAMVRRHRKYVTHDEDTPVLASAILADSDYVVTGDKQFANRAVVQMVELISCSELLLKLPPK
jgi:putative PIN family toxin of toxin-antitoxin system